MPLPKSAGLPDFAILGEVPGHARFTMWARQVGQRIDTRALTDDFVAGTIATHGGLTFAFRHGVIVSLGSDSEPERRLDALLDPYIVSAEDAQETEKTNLIVRDRSDNIAADGQIQLVDASPERFLLVAIVLARSVSLSRDEILVSEAFNRISPFVMELRENGRASLSIKHAMRLVGNALAARHRIMETAQANDRPDLIWDHPELGRLYSRLEAEYELDERAEVLDRKFVALGDVAEVLLDIVRDKRAYRVELAIIALIAFEILLSLFDITVRLMPHG